MKKLEFLKVLNSPFKIPRLKFYLGKLNYGTPYFYPRRWVSIPKDEAKESATEKLNNLVDAGKKPKPSLWKQLYIDALKSKKAVPKKIGFDLVGLGYKYKWDEPRFEWGPMLSFVFFKWQFCIFVSVPETSHYWESWIYYYKETDKNLSKKERLEICKKEFPMIWTRSYGTGPKETIDYYTKILKKKYL